MCKIKFALTLVVVGLFIYGNGLAQVVCKHTTSGKISALERELEIYKKHLSTVVMSATTGDGSLLEKIQERIEVEKTVGYEKTYRAMKAREDFYGQIFSNNTIPTAENWIQEPDLIRHYSPRPVPAISERKILREGSGVLIMISCDEAEIGIPLSAKIAGMLGKFLGDYPELEVRWSLYIPNGNNSVTIYVQRKP